MPQEGTYVFWPEEDGSHSFGRLLFKGNRISSVYVKGAYGGKVIRVPTVSLSILDDTSVKIFGKKEKHVKLRIHEMEEEQPEHIIQPLNAEEFLELTQVLQDRLKKLQEELNLHWPMSDIIKTANHLAYAEKNQLFLEQLEKAKSKIGKNQ